MSTPQQISFPVTPNVPHGFKQLASHPTLAGRELYYNDAGCVLECVGGTWREVDTYITARGREVIRLRDDRIGPRVGRLILEAHAGPPPGGKPLCLHYDDNPLNNAPSNLRWGSHDDNMRDLRRNRPELFRFDETTVMSARALASVNDIRGLAELIKRTGAAYRTLHHVLTGGTWKRVGGPLLTVERANKIARLVRRELRSGGQQW